MDRAWRLEAAPAVRIALVGRRRTWCAGARARNPLRLAHRAIGGFVNWTAVRRRWRGGAHRLVRRWACRDAAKPRAHAAQRPALAPCRRLRFGDGRGRVRAWSVVGASGRGGRVRPVIARRARPAGCLRRCGAHRISVVLAGGSRGDGRLRVLAGAAGSRPAIVGRACGRTVVAVLAGGRGGDRLAAVGRPRSGVARRVRRVRRSGRRLRPRPRGRRLPLHRRRRWLSDGHARCRGLGEPGSSGSRKWRMTSSSSGSTGVGQPSAALPDAMR